MMKDEQRGKMVKILKRNELMQKDETNDCQ